MSAEGARRRHLWIECSRFLPKIRKKTMG